MSRAVPRFRRTNLPLPVATNNLFEVIVKGQVDGQLTINTFYYQDDQPAGTPKPQAETDLATGWWTALGASYRGCISSDWALSNLICACISIPSRKPVAYFPGGVNPGTGPAGHVPTTVCGVILRNTAWKGQSGRGRISMPALPSIWSNTTGSTMSNAGNTQFAAFAAALLSPAIAGGGANYLSGLVSRRGKGTAVTLGYGRLTAMGTPLVLGSCRRRKIGRGK